MKVHIEKINDAEANREKIIEISGSLDNDFVSCVRKAKLTKIIQDSGFRNHDSGFRFQSKQTEATK